MDYYLGQVQAFAFNFAPIGWAKCEGQLLPISQNQALFSLLGTTYGGDGRSTFALPDLRGRVPLNQGQGPGLSNYLIGQSSGSETVTLTVSQMPAHNHLVTCSTNVGNVGSPANAIPGAENVAGADIWSNAAPNATMNPQMIGASGGSQPHNNMQPYLAINWCIAMQGIFPARS